MRGGFFFFGGAKRNDPVELDDPHPLTNYGDDVCTGRACHDGFTVMSRANPRAQGNPPAVSGAIGPAPFGPDQSFEQ